MRTVPIYYYIDKSTGKQIRFAVDSDFWLTNLTGDDGIALDITEQQTSGQVGTTIIGTAIDSRTITATGAILKNLDVNERILKQLLSPGAEGRWVKQVGQNRWYLETIVKRSPDVSGGEHRLNFQFSLHAAYSYWRTEEQINTLLGGLEATWFPTPVSTSGSWYISKYKQDLYTTVTNTGNTPVGFVITLVASARVVNPMIWNNGTRTFVKLNKAIETGDRVVISTQEDTRGCTITYSAGTQEDGFRYMDVDTDWWMTLDPGENVLRLTADSGRENLTATIGAPKGVASNV